MAPIIRPAEPQREFEAIAPELEQVLLDVARGGWYIQGPQHDAFETEFASYLGASSCIGVANGTDALELALRATGAGPGTEVITVANAGGYTSTATRSIGATPRYIDIDPNTLLLDHTQLRGAINDRTRAMVVTHLYGYLHPDIDHIAQVCHAAGIALIEDCAQAHGAQRDGRKAGTFGTAATFSFYPTKNLGALGDAGAVITNDNALAIELRALRQYGWSDRYNTTVAGGRNSRLDEMQAAVLRVKLGYLDVWNQRRRDVVAAYRGAEQSRWWAGNGGPDDVAHLAITRSPDRASFRAALEQAGIGTAIHFPIADHRQQAHRSDVALPNTELACDEVVTLPAHAFLTDVEVARVCDALTAHG